MAEEIAALVAALSSGDLSQKLRSDASASVLRIGFQKLYSILRLSVKPVDCYDGSDAGKAGRKLVLEVWDQSRIHGLACVSIAVVKAFRSLSVEQVEPVVVAVVQQSIEFALCYLEKWTGKSDDSILQNTMVQLLELLLVDGVHKELELSQSCQASVSVDLLSTIVDKDDAVLWHDNANCMLQGSMCCQELEADDHLLTPLISECEHFDIVNPAEQSFPSNANKFSTISQHWAIIHLRCIQRLILLCREILELPALSDEKQASLSFRRKLSTCLRLLKLPGSFAKAHSYFYSDNLLLHAVASFIDVLPRLFRTSVELANSSLLVESSCEGLALHILEEFLQVMQAAFCNNHVFQNIQVCAAASILSNWGSDVWRFNKSFPSNKTPLAYFPRVIIFVLKLISNIKDQGLNFEVDGLNKWLTASNSALDSPSCNACCGKVLLSKKHTVEELFGILFPSSVQWLDNLMHLVIFLHSEGIKVKPILEKSCSSGTKSSAISEVESIICHEDEALFGDLFSESGRSAGSVDVCEQCIAVDSSISSFSNVPFQAAIELLGFLKTCAFSPQWHPPIYQDVVEKLNENHIDILLSS